MRENVEFSYIKLDVCFSASIYHKSTFFCISHVKVVILPEVSLKTVSLIFSKPSYSKLHLHFKATNFSA